MIGPVSTTASVDLGKVLKTFSTNTLSLAKESLAFTKLGMEVNNRMNGQLPSVTLQEPIARMLILFLKSINDQDSIDSARSKFLPLYHQAI
ncbi:MAG: hypothetical protein H0U49_00885, partial [Parachlamydiaceae bacterium]|nr:hypothetical protein [Parachlamydiaceae bacterium]